MKAVLRPFLGSSLLANHLSPTPLKQSFHPGLYPSPGRGPLLFFWGFNYQRGIVLSFNVRKTMMNRLPPVLLS